jgi:hypothetical protein
MAFANVPSGFVGRSEDKNAVRDTANITINLPHSLCGTFRAAASNQAMSEREACRRIVYGLSGLTDADLRSLPEPPPEYRNRDLRIELEWQDLDKLSEVSRVCRLTVSTIFRRTFYAILITRTIRFIPCKRENDICMQLNQIRADFTDDFEGDGPIPLPSRQHREQP